MSGRPLFTLVAGFSALLGMAAAGYALDPATGAPETALPSKPTIVGDAPHSAPETIGESPASILVEMRYSSLHRISQFADDDQTFTVPVYFAPDATEPGEEARLLLSAVADEAAAYAGVAITIRAVDPMPGAEGAARAMAVFTQLNEMGVPARNMAIELEQGPEARLATVTSAI